MTREELLKSLINIHGNGLEIGPGYNPLLPKKDGYRIQTADYTTADGLREKYRGNPSVDISRIETVDYVVSDAGLFNTIGKYHHFDYIVASHVIEHTPDMVRFLKDCEKLLAPDGVLLLAVPDKRYCFDVFQPLSSVGQILQAHWECRTRPSLSAIVDDRVYNAVRNKLADGQATHAGALSFFLDITDARQVLQIDRRSDSYIDVHVWKFVPSSFRLIINDLFELGEIGMREDVFFDTVGIEFYCRLSSSGAGCPISRLELAKAVLVEQTKVTD